VVYVVKISNVNGHVVIDWDVLISSAVSNSLVYMLACFLKKVNLHNNSFILVSCSAVYCCIVIIINEEEIRVTLSHRDVAGALYIN